MLRNIMVCLLALWVGACASYVSLPPEIVAPINERENSGKPLSERELLQNGIYYLGNALQPPDYGRARTSFTTLVNSYPDSRWKGVSKSFVGLIEERQLCQEKSIQAEKVREERDNLREEINRLLQENEKLKKDIRQLNDRLRTEMSRLSEENEQLKKDIQLLKNLEIELEKRDKRFR